MKRFASCAVLIPLLALGGCSLYFPGGDSEPPPPSSPDAPPPSSPDDPPPESPSDLELCRTTDVDCEWYSPFELAEGGEIRLERIQRGSNDERVAAQALFFLEQVPAMRPFTGPELPQASPIDNSWCVDLRDMCYFDSGSTSACQAIVDTRTYFDLGTTVTLASQANEIALSRQPEGAVDPAQQLQHEILYLGDAGADVASNTFYAAAVGDLGLTLDVGDLATGEALSGEPGIFMPPRFSLTQPAEGDFFAAPTVLTSGENTAFAWETMAAPAPGAPPLLAFARLANEQGVVEALCYTKNEGGITIPPEVIDIVSPAGEITIGKLFHAAWYQVEHGTRLDLIGIDSKVGRYLVSQGL